MATKKEQEYVQAIQNTMAAIDEVLAKSGWNDGEDMEKADGDMPQDEMGAQADDAMAGAETPSEGAPAPDAGMPPDAAPGAGQDQDLASMAAEMSDEELQMMVEVLQSELANRQGQGAPEGAPAPDAGMPPAAPAAPAPEEKSLAMSMKSEYAKMAKSIEALTATVEALTKATKPAAKPAARPAAANRDNVQVLEKSTPAASTSSKLSKSETENFLLGEMRNGNRKVNSSLISDVGYANTPAALRAVHEEIRKMGITLPS